MEEEAASPPWEETTEAALRELRDRKGMRGDAAGESSRCDTGDADDAPVDKSEVEMSEQKDEHREEEEGFRPRRLPSSADECLMKRKGQ